MKKVDIAREGTHRVLVVANHPGIVYAFRRALANTTGFTLIGYVSSQTPLKAVVADAHPDVVVIDDLCAPAEAVKRISEARRGLPEAKIVLLVSDTSLDWIEDAVRVGAHAVLSKHIDPVCAGVLLREIVRGTVFHCLPNPTVRVGSDEQVPGSGPVAMGLTHREVELLRLVASGATNATLASQLFVTQQTVKFHLSNIYRKLGVANRTEASVYAHKHGLVEATPELRAA